MTNTPQTQSDTPRTDTEELDMGADVVDADFARTLERELAEAKIHIKELERKNASWRVSWEQRNEEDIDASAALAKSERT